MGLIEPLPQGALDIVGDVHGEVDALRSLLHHLGYDVHGGHAQGRRLVFVGDLCDRGPDSPAVISLMQTLVGNGRALAILGNHELNLLRADAKEGSGWYFDERVASDRRYAPFARAVGPQRQEMLAFLGGLPIALERADLRIVHAAWQHDAIATVRALPAGAAHQHYERWDALAVEHMDSSGLRARYLDEKQRWKAELVNPHAHVDFLEAIAEHDVTNQMFNPLRVLTSGVERKGSSPFFSSGKWRFVDRVRWWDGYADAIPVVVGHYWRRLTPVDRKAVGKGDPDLFDNVNPLAWHGLNRNVFCVDFSVGGRWQERESGVPLGSKVKLAALRWPERNLVLETGEHLPTIWDR